MPTFLYNLKQKQQDNQLFILLHYWAVELWKTILHF